MVKMLTVLVSKISNSQIFLLKNMSSLFFNKNNNIYAIFYDQSFNDTLTDGIICFEQLGPEFQFLILRCYINVMCPA